MRASPRSTPAPPRRLPGVTAVRVIAPAGTEVQWEARKSPRSRPTTEEIARDAVRKIKVEYEVLPHLVKKTTSPRPAARARPPASRCTGDPDKAFQEAEAVSEGDYGIPVITHCCLEPHGSVVQWKGDQVHGWPSTQNVTGWASTLAPNLKVPAANIQCRWITSAADSAASSPRIAGARSARSSRRRRGGKPVKLFLDRAAELTIAGQPAVGVRQDQGRGQEGRHDHRLADRNPGRPADSRAAAARRCRTSSPTFRTQRLQPHGGFGQRGTAPAWRAPNNQQASLPDLLGAGRSGRQAGMDPLEVFDKNAGYTPRAGAVPVPARQGRRADATGRSSGIRAASRPAPVKRGLGIGVNTWGGGGHASKCRTTINPDGSVVVEMGTQDLGTGTRTIITQVAAETLGCRWARSSWDRRQQPASGRSSGGSTTVGGVSSSTRKSAVNALAKLFEAVAPALGVQPEQAGSGGRPHPGEGQSRQEPDLGGGLPEARPSARSPRWARTSRAIRGADSAAAWAACRWPTSRVDTETGIVKMNRFVAVQDCGLVINPRLAESQIYGACIMGICTALFEERIMDDADRPHAESRHGVLQAGRHRRYRRDRRAPGYPRGERQARRDRSGRTAGHRHLRGDRQCGGQRHRRAGAARCR